jgi:hypothetical protein
MLVTFLWNLLPFRQIFEKTQIPNFMKIRPAGDEFFHAARQADTTKLTVTFFAIFRRRLKLSSLSGGCEFGVNRAANMRAL